MRRAASIGRSKARPLYVTSRSTLRKVGGERSQQRRLVRVVGEQVLAHADPLAVEPGRCGEKDDGPGTRREPGRLRVEIGGGREGRQAPPAASDEIGTLRSMTRAVPPSATSVRASNQRASAATRSSGAMPGGWACAGVLYGPDGGEPVDDASAGRASVRSCPASSSDTVALAAHADLDRRPDAGGAAVGAAAAVDRLATGTEQLVGQGEEALGEADAARDVASYR